MNMMQAKEAAIQLANGAIAVIVRNGDDWQPGAHNESKYLESFFEGEEIHIYGKHGKSAWIVYKAPGKPVDYVGETGATGDLARMLRNLQIMQLDDD